MNSKKKISILIGVIYSLVSYSQIKEIDIMDGVVHLSYDDTNVLLIIENDTIIHQSYCSGISVFRRRTIQFASCEEEYPIVFIEREMGLRNRIKWIHIWYNDNKNTTYYPAYPIY